MLPNGMIFSVFGLELDYFEQNGPELVRKLYLVLEHNYHNSFFKVAIFKSDGSGTFLCPKHNISPFDPERGDQPGESPGQFETK